MQKRKKRITRWAALFVLASASSLAAHHALTQFDTTTGVTLKGTVVRFERVNPHSFLYIEAKGKDGDTQLWTIEGPNVTQLSRMGIAIDALKAGDAVEACGYVLKEGRSRHFLTGELLTAGEKTFFTKSVFETFFAAFERLEDRLGTGR